MYLVCLIYMECSVTNTQDISKQKKNISVFKRLTYLSIYVFVFLSMSVTNMGVTTQSS